MLKGVDISLNFVGISPHPPIIVPEIGGADVQKVSETILAMRKLANNFREAEIDTLIIISPHMLTYPDRFNICGMAKLFGTFAQFGTPDLIQEFNNDSDLAADIDENAKKANLNTILYNNNAEFFELDHGLMVPLYYLAKNLDSALKIVPIAYSLEMTRAQHFSFGQVIAEVVKNYPGRVGIIASGDLSHRLIQGAPAGYSEAGKDFDKQLVDDIANNNSKNIMLYDDDFVADAGECGYRSILILLGALSNQNAKPEVLSYEGPFGVGYLVADFKLKD